MRVALAQVRSSPDLTSNLRAVSEMTAQAAAAGAALVAFPEAMMCCFGVPLRPVAQGLDGPWAEGVRAIAREHAVSVVAGMFTPADGARVRNTLLVAGPDGDASYDKIHLFDAFGFSESQTVAPGSSPTVVEVAGARVGLATCYDLRFPGLFGELARRGAQIVVVCASWGAGHGKVDHWRLLTRARALDSTTFVLAVDQAASPAPDDDGAAPRGVGHSVVVSPWGTPIGELGPLPGLLTAELDLADVGRARASIPVLANARW